MDPYFADDDATIYCADTTLALRSLQASLVDAVITDPPYSSGGMVRGDRTGSVRAKYQQSEVAKWSKLPEFGGDTRDQRAYGYWCTLWLAECLRIAKPGAVCCVFTDWRQLPVTTDALQAAGWVWRGVVVWDKTPAARPALGRFASQSEFVAWGSKGPLQEDRGIGCLPGVIVHPPLYEGRDDKEHIAQKPIDVMRRLVAICPSGGTVLDPFIGIEQDPHFAEVAARRLAQSVLPLSLAAD
jgi:site-specific DNA-methyltransferase (adenine-specific)